jgi:hypothetical protein
MTLQKYYRDTMNKTNLVTLRAAFDFLGGKSVNLGDVQSLCNGPRKAGQGWTYFGDWKRKVAPTFFSK